MAWTVQTRRAGPLRRGKLFKKSGEYKTTERSVTKEVHNDNPHRHNLPNDLKDLVSRSSHGLYYC
eukprot:4829073-Amphidinium_carterae.1